MGQQQDDVHGLYISARYMRGLIEYVRDQGATIAPVLDALGLTEEKLHEPDSQVPHALQDRAFEVAEQVTGDPNVGLHAGESANVTYFGVVGQLALTCRTGAELLDLQVRYQSLIGNGVRSTRTRTPNEVLLEFDLARSAPSRHSLEYTLAAQTTLARFLAGPGFVAKRWTFTHAEPAHSEEQRRVFGCPVLYDCQHTRVHFPVAIETLPLGGSDPGVREALEAAARRRLELLRERFQHKDSELARCQQYIADRLSSGAPSVEETAAALETSVRTLQRRLELHGLNYRDVTELARKRTAERLIADPTLSLLDVALLVGFSDQSAFNRAFRRWFNTTPGELRAMRLSEPR